jgi:hypothetical protein
LKCIILSQGILEFEILSLSINKKYIKQFNINSFDGIGGGKFSEILIFDFPLRKLLLYSTVYLRLTFLCNRTALQMIYVATSATKITHLIG